MIIPAAMQLIQGLMAATQRRGAPWNALTISQQPEMMPLDQNLLWSGMTFLRIVIPLQPLV
jgi:hypothetical protein